MRQNEFLTWIRQDPHAKAYRSLQSEAGQRIARNLGLANAQDAPVCLSCHTDNVPITQRGRGFAVADGVGCEACHGGAERWLGVHVSGTSSRAENVAAGMHPLDDPVTRGQLCLGCHLGTADRWVTHRIMGAGHPRLRFELDTFTAAQPAHFVVDADYRQRKRVVSPAQTWLVGQVLAARHFLDGLADPGRNTAGLFPEFTFYDCHACHHPMKELQFEAATGAQPGPGMPRLQDTSLILVKLAAETLAPELGESLGASLRHLHEATWVSREAQMQAARSLRAEVAKAQTRLARDPDRTQVGRLIERLFALSVTPGYRSFEAAEQVTMALGAMVAHLRQHGMIDEPGHKRANAALEAVYKTVESDRQFSIAAYTAALQGLKAALPAI